MDVFLTLIVPASAVAQSRAFAKTLDDAHGEGMWTTGLSKTGKAPATHYISTGHVSETTASLLPSKTWKQDENGAWASAIKHAPNTAELASRVKGPKGSVDALLAAADISDQDPWEAMSRLDLKLVQS